MLELGEIRWSDLRVTDKFTDAKLVMEKLELFVQPDRKRKTQKKGQP